MEIGSVILAAGNSKRMNSAIPKVIHPLLGKPLISYAITSAKAVATMPPVVVVGYERDKVMEVVHDEVHFAVQKEQLGTAHAVMMAEPYLAKKADMILITSADMPLISAEMLRTLVEVQAKNKGPLSLVSVHADEARGFGRLIRDEAGNAQAIVEEKVATEEQLKIHEYNAGIYCVKNDWLWDVLKKIKKSSVGEYFLTDLLALAVQNGENVSILTLANSEEAMGINNRIHLAEVEKVMRRRSMKNLCLLA